MKINTLALAISLGILWGLGVFILGLTSYFFNYGTDIVKLIGSVYIGYKPGIIGSIIGLIWGFIDAFIGGVILGWIYNILCGKIFEKKQE